MADAERSTRGRRANNAGKAYEREIAEIIPGGKRVGMYGGIVDVMSDRAGIIAQCKLGGSFPTLLNRYLDAVSQASKADQTPIVVVGNRPGPGIRRTSLVVLRIEDFVRLIK
jgi:hypothetical protein